MVNGVAFDATQWCDPSFKENLSLKRIYISKKRRNQKKRLQVHTCACERDRRQKRLMSIAGMKNGLNFERHRKMMNESVESNTNENKQLQKAAHGNGLIK
jgi:hypothetical protein